MDKFMVIVNFKNCIRNNWEITDFDLSLTEANGIVKDMLRMQKTGEIDEDWDFEEIKIVRQGELLWSTNWN